jgi:hypothetical protein
MKIIGSPASDIYLSLSMVKIENSRLFRLVVWNANWWWLVVVVRALRNRAPLMIRPPTSLRRLFFFVCFLSFGNTFKQKYIYLNTHRHANVQCDKRRLCQDGGRGRAHTTHETGSSFVSNFPPTI